MERFYVGRVVEVVDLKKLLDLVYTLVRKQHLLGLLVHGEVVVFPEARHYAVYGVIFVGRVLRGPRYDKRGPCLVYEDGVDLVHYGEVVLPLDVLLEGELHVVSEVIEAVLVIGAVGYIGVVGLFPADGAEVYEAAGTFRVGWVVKKARLVLDDAHGKAERVICRAHPVGVPPGEIIVHRDQVRALAREGVQVQGERGDERFSLARLHLRDLALVQYVAAYELDVEVAHLELSPRHLTDGREGPGQYVLDRLAARELFLQSGRKLLETLVAQSLHLGFKGVYLVNYRQYPLHFAVVLGAEHLFKQIIYHL